MPGPYAGRVVVNPGDLRRGSKRLHDLSGQLHSDAARLTSAPTPVTAPEVAGIPSAVHELGSTLDALVQPLGQAAVELNRRALWAEIADELVAGVPLTSAQLTQFMAGLRDGTLIRYAEPWQADLAGSYIGRLYRESYDDDPGKLRELVTILRRNGGAFDEAHGAFFSGFINDFGATNVAHIARVIQEMEMPGAYQDINGWNDTERMFKYFNAGVRLDDKDALDFMTTFGMAVAVATSTGQLTRWAPGAEEKIGYDPDAWSVAQLLAYKGPFGATFLRDVFQNGLVAQIGRDAGNMSGFKSWEREIRIGGDRGITTDQTRLILDALGRNPHAAALALSDPLPKDLQISYLLAGNSNPLAAVYDHFDWQDGGKELAALYHSGVDWCYQNGDETRAYHLTASLIDRTIHSDWRRLDPMTEALASDLRDHHMADVFLSASAPNAGGPHAPYEAAFVGNAEVDGVRGLHLIVDKADLTSLVRAFSDHPPADETFLEGARDYQAQLIREHTTAEALKHGDLLWANQLGSFDGVIMNAHDLDLADQFDKDNLKHQIFFKFLETTVGVVSEGSPAGAGADLLINGVDDATKPSFESVVQSADDEKELLIATSHAAIAAGYYENGVLDHGALPPPELIENGHLVPFDKAMRNYVLWVGTNHHLYEVAGEAFDRVDQARDNRALPAVPH